MYQLNLQKMNQKRREKSILAALEKIYVQGMETGKLSTALRCLELLAKRYSPAAQDEIDLSPAYLDRLLRALQCSLSPVPAMV